MSELNWSDIENQVEIVIRRERKNYPVVTMSKNGMITFNAAFCHKYADDLENCEYGSIYYSKNNNAFILKVCEKPSPKNLVRLHTNGKGMQVSVVKLSKKNNIEIKYREFNLKIVNITNLGKCFALFL
jgi:hypothetical protein